MDKKTIWQLLSGSPQLYFTQDKWWTTEDAYNELKKLAKEEICRAWGCSYEEGLELDATKRQVTILAEQLTKAQMEIERLNKSAGQVYASLTYDPLNNYPTLAVENKQLRQEKTRLETYIAKQEETIKGITAELNELQTKGDTARRKDFNPEFWDWVTTKNGWLCVFKK